jgi:hypothetical protein
MLGILGRTPRDGSPSGGPLLAGQKQLNEAFHRSPHFLALRA